MKNRIHLFTFTALIFLSSMPIVSTAQDSRSETVDFKNDIAPIFESNCLSCHGPEDPDGGYQIDNADNAMDYVEAGDSENSDLYQYLISDEEDEMMPPPDEGGPLDDSDIQLIKTWIDEGAVWPDGLELQMPDNGGAVGGDVAEATGETSDEVTTASTDEPGHSQKGPNVYRALGALHAAALHMPMGLLLAAGFFALLSLRGNFVMSDCAYYCLWLGALTAVVACVTGLWFMLSEFPKEYPESFSDLLNQGDKTFLHRTSAFIATIFALFLALFAASARNKDPDDGVFWKLGLIVLAMGIGYVGHQGGKLTWKESHYDELWEVVDQLVPGMVADEKDAEDATPKESDGVVEEEDGGTHESDVETKP